MPDFAVDRIESGEAVTLVLSGELDLASADTLTLTAEPVPANGSLTLELAGLTFVDSSGLKVFMNLDRRSRREGWTLSMRSPNGQVLRLLQLCGFDTRLPIIQSSEG